MIEHSPPDESYKRRAWFHGAVPADLQQLIESFDPQLDRMLGYRGHRRFVIFHFMPQMNDAVWENDDSCGIGIGGWWAFLDHVAPLVDLYGFNLGNAKAMARDVLVIDRLTHQAHFASRTAAERFVSRLGSDGEERRWLGERL